MTGAYLTTLFDYDSAVNRQVLDHLRSLPSLEARTAQVFAHLLAAQQVWIFRLRGQDASGVAIWPDLSWDACAALIDENARDYRNFLEGKSAADLEEAITYRNSQGVAFRNARRDVLMHVLLHGGYHRGQIMVALRAQGHIPLSTDYIMHIRNPLDGS